jgi:hypothetical protein
MSPLTEPTRLTLAKSYIGTDDPDAAAYIAAVEAADEAASPGVGALETATRVAIHSFVKGCKADGIWPAIKASCILAGARTLSGALMPLTGTAPTNFNFVSGDYNRKTGLVGNGSTKYLDSNRANNADPQNNLHVSVYASTTSAAYIGNLNNNVHLAATSSLIGVRLNSGDGVVSSSPNVAGFLGGSRSLSSTIIFRGGKTSNSVASASVTRSAENLFVFRTFNGYLTPRISFYSIGESLDLALLDARVTDLITAFGAAIP